MQHSAEAPLSTPSVDREWIEIRSSGIHGQGAFARCSIPAESRIIEYVGERVDKAESARRCDNSNPYIFAINDEWDIDGDVPWNPARFFNHSCSPNCESRQEEDRIWIWTLRDIAPGEELTYNYGYDLTEWRDYPCQCGAANCVGFIVAEEFQETVRRQLVSACEVSNTAPA
jgi:SET domain-containing protein